MSMTDAPGQTWVERAASAMMVFNAGDRFHLAIVAESLQRCDEIRSALDLTPYGKDVVVASFVYPEEMLLSRVRGRTFACALIDAPVFEKFIYNHATEEASHIGIENSLQTSAGLNKVDPMSLMIHVS